MDQETGSPCVSRYFYKGITLGGARDRREKRFKISWLVRYRLERSSKGSESGRARLLDQTALKVRTNVTRCAIRTTRAHGNGRKWQLDKTEIEGRRARGEMKTNKAVSLSVRGHSYDVFWEHAGRFVLGRKTCDHVAQRFTI